MYILVFKTNINTLRQLNKIKPFLNALPNLIRWDWDEEDIDKVLRIEINENNPALITNTLRSQGYQCEELPD